MTKKKRLGRIPMTRVHLKHRNRHNSYSTMPAIAYRRKLTRQNIIWRSSSAPNWSMRITVHTMRLGLWILICPSTILQQLNHYTQEVHPSISVASAQTPMRDPSCITHNLIVVVTHYPSNRFSIMTKYVIAQTKAASENLE